MHWCFFALLALFSIARTTSERLTVLTGANDAYFGALTNAVGSIKFWCPHCDVLVFNLGLSESHLQLIERNWCNVQIAWRDAYLHGNPRIYAFKANAIAYALDAGFEYVFWIDAGSTILAPFDSYVLDMLRRDGHLFVQGQDLDMLLWTHRGMLARMNVSDASAFAHRPSYSGNTLGVRAHSAAHEHIIRPWLACARDMSCIAPDGSSTRNHRYDQAALSVIIHRLSFEQPPPVLVEPHTEILSARRLGACGTPSTQLVWTSRGSESCYRQFATTPCSSSSSSTDNATTQ